MTTYHATAEAMIPVRMHVPISPTISRLPKTTTNQISQLLLLSDYCRTPGSSVLTYLPTDLNRRIYIRGLSDITPADTLVFLATPVSQSNVRARESKIRQRTSSFYPLSHRQQQRRGQRAVGRPAITALPHHCHLCLAKGATVLREITRRLSQPKLKALVSRVISCRFKQHC